MKISSTALVAIIVCSLLAVTALQSTQAVPTVNVSFYKNNGYGVGNDMNGEWTLNADASSDTVRVEFYLDGHLVENDTTAPYSWHFNTSNYTEGLHLFRAMAYDDTGHFGYVEVTRNFVPFPLDFVVGIIALVAITLVVVLVGALIRARKLRKTK